MKNKKNCLVLCGLYIRENKTTQSEKKKNKFS